jgi:hypothetical protein
MLSWKVKNYSINHGNHYDYDVLKYRQDDIKKLKKKCATQCEFAVRIYRDLRSQYWSRSEYEIVIEIDDNNRIWLKPWVGCKNPDDEALDVTEDTSFDWRGFAEMHIGRQNLGNKAKVDIWDQIAYRWDEFIDYLWYTRLKYERDDPKFHKTEEETV